MYESFLLTQVYIFHLFQKKQRLLPATLPRFSQQDVDMVIEAVPEIMDLKKWLGGLSGSGGRSNRAVVGSCRKFQLESGGFLRQQKKHLYRNEQKSWWFPNMFTIQNNWVSLSHSEPIP